VRKQKRINPRRLGLAGSSVGAFAALMAAPAIRPVVVLALSPAGNGAFGADAGAALVRAVEQSHAAVLVLAAADDPEAAGNAKAVKDVFGVCAVTLPGKDHGFALFPARAGFMAGWMTEYLTYRAPRMAKKTVEQPAGEP
jgi:hypothetical protein